MRLSKAQVTVNRQKILQAATRLMSANGVESVSVADVMKEAGFTHGGFYNHFESKEHLVEEVCQTSMESTAKKLEGLLAQNSTHPLKEFQTIFAETNKDSFPFAMLAVQAAMQNPLLQRHFTTGLSKITSLADTIFTTVNDSDLGDTLAESLSRQDSLLLLAAILGLTVLTRALSSSENPTLATHLKKANKALFS